MLGLAGDEIHIEFADAEGLGLQRAASFEVRAVVFMRAGIEHAFSRAIGL